MKNTHDIQKKHFHIEGLNVEVYDQRFKKGPDPLLAGDIDFYVDYACRWAAPVGRPVLELGSGTGRISWEMARYGCEVVGLDMSEAMIRQADSKRENFPDEVRRRVMFIQGDMTDFDLGQTYPLVIIPCRSFQCLQTVEQQLACLEAISRHLEPGGRLILNLFDPRFTPMNSSDWQKDFSRVPVLTHPKTGNPVQLDLVSRSSDFFSQTIEEIWCYREKAPDGTVLREEESTLRMRWTLRQEMRHLFALSGFEVEGEYSDFYRSAPSYGKEQVWVVRRQG